jgi:hypothetical protein
MTSAAFVVLQGTGSDDFTGGGQAFVDNFLSGTV